MGFAYPLREKAVFYLDYFFRKAFCVWFEVKRPKLRMFLYEMAYSARKFLDYKALYPSPFGTDMVETVFGKFRVRPRTLDMSNASPAFERRDLNRLLALIDGLRARGKKVLFLDVGADIGTFTVTVGNRFKGYGGLRVMAFEPARSSFGILKENIGLNGLEGVCEPYNFAIYSADGVEMEFSFCAVSPGTSGLRGEASTATEKVMARTLDAVLAGRLEGFDAVVMKLDVEGAECDVIAGAKAVISSGKEIYFLVEDFVEPAVIECLENAGARFVEKLTPYNSFWRAGGPVARAMPFASGPAGGQARQA